ncbi:MAG TPA: ATP-binding protein, partial [Urbifossiella sp.]
VALANEGGGKIILGVTDRRPRQVVGTEAFAEPGRTEAGLFQRLYQRIPVEESHCLEGFRLLIVHVPSRHPGMAWQIHGKFLKRAGDDLAPMSADELKVIFAETGPDFSAEVCPKAGISDLSTDAIAEFRRRWAAKSTDARRNGWSDVETLTNAELLEDGGVTNAALLLFGSERALGRWLAQAEVVYEYRSSDASGPAAGRTEHRAGFFLYHDRLWNEINSRNDRQSFQEGLFRTDVLTFDEESVREAVLNAVAHRDYRHGGSVFVRQYPRRLEIVSPGGFPAGITPENILDGQNPRNRRLAEALAKCGLIERSGQGVNLMFENAVRQGKALPSFVGTTADEVRLTLEGAVQHPAMIRFLERVGADKVNAFSTYDFLVLDRLHRDIPLTEDLRTRLPGLVAAGAVEMLGRARGTRYILSRGLYAALGQSGTYTRKAGLDRDTNKALLLKHITRHASLGSTMKELMQVLPSLGRGQIQVLLRELVAANEVHVRGVTRAGRWYPGPNDFSCNPTASGSNTASDLPP